MSPTRPLARRASTPRLLLSLLLALALAGCSSLRPAPSPDWQEVEVEIPSDRVLWKIVLLAAESNGYPLTGSMDPSSKEVLTGWKLNLHPFSGRGNRMRAELKLEPKGPRLWTVSAHVQKQLNMAIVSPLDPVRAEWEWTDDDVTETRILLRHVLSALPSDLPIRNAPPDPFEAELEQRARRSSAPTP